MIRLQVIATFHCQVQSAVISPFYFGKARVEPKLDALDRRYLEQTVAHLLVIAAQYDVGAVDQGHVTTELVEDTGEFIGDVAAARDDDPLGQILQMEHLVRTDRMFDAFHIGHKGPRARSDQNLASADLPTARQLHLIRASERCSFVEDLYLMIAQCLGI